MPEEVQSLLFWMCPRKPEESSTETDEETIIPPENAKTPSPCNISVYALLWVSSKLISFKDKAQDTNPMFLSS